MLNKRVLLPNLLEMSVDITVVTPPQMDGCYASVLVIFIGL